MGRQFRVYLLPADVDNLLSYLKENLGARVFAAESSTSSPPEVVSRTLDRSHPCHSGLQCYGRCYLSRDAQIATWFIEKRGYWLTNTESEVIEFDGCDFGDLALVEGRFYYQIDRLSLRRDALVPKGRKFVEWAEEVFRRSKKLLLWDKELQAYVGTEAAQWRKQGGVFTQGFELRKPSQPSRHTRSDLIQ
jgi:hypothetical protein